MVLIYVGHFLFGKLLISIDDLLHCFNHILSEVFAPVKIMFPTEGNIKLVSYFQAVKVFLYPGNFLL